ncbi:hypothetical protein [Effusibacillus consociatus]|uniref:Uncharacterized protein n=1 Tax=Effusibacillus consociatus TaxID=1117041 RepID=A0ABV9Q177_9BACL
MYSSFTFPQKILLLISVVLLLSGGAFWYLSWQKERIATEVQARADAVTVQMNLLQKQAAQKVNPPDLVKLGRAIPTEWEIGWFFADLTTAAKQSQVTLVQVAPGQPVEKQPAKNGTAANPPAKQGSSGEADLSSPPPELSGVFALEVALTAQGDPVDLLSFVDQLQRMPRFVWIKEYNLTFEKKGGASAGTGSIAALTLKLTIYSRAPWDSKPAASVEWPFPVLPAGNDHAFGNP